MKDTQCQKILNFIKEHGSINPAQAFNYLGCYRLGARIKDLRDEGYNIQTELATSKNAAGDTVRYAVYSLAKGA